MPRKAAPAIPGETTTREPEAEAPANPGEGMDLSEQIAYLLQRDALREAEVADLRRKQGRQAPEPTAPLPTMAEALKKGKPESPVLTREGWFVPATLPNAAGRV